MDESMRWWCRVVCILGLAACRNAPPPIADAPPDVLADPRHVVLTWQLATILPSGAPSPQLEYPPFAPGAVPQIRIATLDGPFAPASYSSDPATPGWITVPGSYFQPTGGASTVAPWRLEYTLPGGVPHEIQWAPEDKLGHLVVPMVGRLDRSPVPAGSGYAVTTTHAFGATENPAVLTTGLWTAGAAAPPSGMVVDYDYASATSLSGTSGSPDAAQGDRGFVVDYQVNPDNQTNVLCNVAVGSAALSSLALTAGAHTAQSVTWDTGREPLVSELPGDDMIWRLGAGLGPLASIFSGHDSQFRFGIIPSTSFPGLTGSEPSSPLPVPVMQSLLRCPVGSMAQGPMDPSAIPAANRPTMLGEFPTAVHVQLVEPRPITGIFVGRFSGMETVVLAAPDGGFRLSFPAAFPTRITLATPTVGTVDLAGSNDHIKVGAPTGTFTLDFVPETGVGLRADYYDVYLHRFLSGVQTTERIYTVIAPEVRIDGSVLVPNAEYVFEIRSYAGHPMAARGDFAPVDYPYGSAVVTTLTFKTS